jgi:hypothetical protein
MSKSKTEKMQDLNRRQFLQRSALAVAGVAIVPRRGAWSFVGPRDFVTASQAEGRIHFAGEHLSPFFSWMQGALQSGLHAVKEINEAA